MCVYRVGLHRMRKALFLACGLAVLSAPLVAAAQAAGAVDEAAAATIVMPAQATVPEPPKAGGGETVKLRPTHMSQIKVAKAEKLAFNEHKAAIGQIAFNEDASTVVLSPFSGRVTKLVAKIGDRVERGSPLFEIDSPEVVQAQTDLIAAVQGLGKANSQLSLTQRTLARLTDLLASKATSVRELDQAKSDAAAAESDVKTAEGTLLAARNRLRVLVGRSEADIAKVEKERLVDPTFVVTSPIAGTIVTRKVGPGQYVRSDSADPLFTISDLTTMWLKASVSENDISLMKPGQEIEVFVPALQNRRYVARITAIGAASDAVTHRVTVRSEIPNTEGALRAEMFATFRIKTGVSPALPSVPIEAILREGDLATVWVEKEPLVFERRIVTIGLEAGNRVQLLSGVTAGERVAGRGAIFIDNEWRQ